MGVIEDGYDLVILKLNKKTCVTPIPNLGHKKATQREDLQFFGYGRTAIGGSYSYVLQGGFFPTYTDKHCNKKYNLNPKLGKRELCVRGPVSVGVCAGDHGGPLILQPSLKKFKDVLVGIASYTSADCTETEGAAVFMDIKKYRPWIRKTRKKALSRTRRISLCSEIEAFQKRKEAMKAHRI